MALRSRMPFVLATPPVHRRRRGRSVRNVGSLSAVALVLALAQVPAQADSGSQPGDREAVLLGPFDEASVAARKAKTSGKPVELVSKRTANSTTYINPDGSTSVQLTPVATRIKEDGEWAKIDTDLTKQGDVYVTEHTKTESNWSGHVGSQTRPLTSSTSAWNMLMPCLVAVAV
jgi:hypothetical protein